MIKIQIQIWIEVATGYECRSHLEYICVQANVNELKKCAHLLQRRLQQQCLGQSRLLSLSRCQRPLALPQSTSSPSAPAAIS